MAKRNPLMLLPAVIFGALVLLFLVSMFTKGPDEQISKQIGKASLPTETLPGHSPITAELLASGEVTLVNFWASWCPPCRAEHPRLMQLAEDGLPIIGLNFNDTKENALKFLEDGGSPYIAIGFDPKGRFAIDWGVTGPPETFIIGKDGKVRFRFVGPLVGSDYEQRFMPELEKALAE
ncbi:MAG: DsbE family thiol:disulfide interchange protein [Sulfitobacter sp.]